MTRQAGSRSASVVAQAENRAIVGIIMGSRSDWETMSAARDTLVELQIPCEVRVVSAHRMPDEMFEYAASARDRGLEAIIAGAGGSAHLPGMTAAKTTIPVIGVPVQTKASGLDSLLSIAQMPPGVPVATMAIGGAVNAALFAARIVALHDADVAERLAAYVARMHDAAASSTLD
jgi:5-(carboxyamino)imidazole ribonucleotide mutase